MIKKILIFLSMLLAANVYSNEADEECQAAAQRQFIFSWPISDACENHPRGGTSTGADVKIATQPRPEWGELQAKGLNKFEQDRRAILAMQGGYKVNFDFLETVGFNDDFVPDRPYQSWATEYVYVVEDKPKFISLQHLIVMYFKQDDGSVSEPMVMKHWRQDWTYEDTSLLEYEGENIWRKRLLTAGDAKGQWSQAVFQVDDSPRYESYGRWQHNDSFSTWLSQKTRRPIPRREFSVRQDYSVLEGFNRHTVTQYGWVQEEENWKLRLDDSAQPRAEMPFLSKEEGLARYQSIIDFDFSAGDEYMTNTALVWKTVREQWTDIIESSKSVELNKSVDSQPMFMHLFSLAENYSVDKTSLTEVRSQVKNIIKRFQKE